MEKKMKRAFTLIELIIVVVIVGILALVAIPRYFANIEKARRAEAYSSMRAIREAILGYYAVNALYPSGFTITVIIDGDAVMQVAEPSSNNFTYDYTGTSNITAVHKSTGGSCDYNMTVATGAVSASAGCSS